MKTAKIRIRQLFTIEIDGKELPGNFEVKSDWEGMVKLECGAPIQSVIINTPPKPANVYDFLPQMLGGNKPNGQAITIEATVVKE